MSNIGIEKRDIDLIDWRKVSTNLVTGLEKEQQRRDTLKKEIEDNTRKLEDDIARTPVGNNDKVNGWIMNYSTKATEGLLAMHRALKNGSVNPREYSTFTANAKSNTSRIFDAVKAFNEESKLVNERSQKGISSIQETQMMALVEGFADLEKSTTIFQPDGNVQIVKLQNGKPIDGADGRITANQLMGLIGTRVDKYDLNASTAAAVKQVGDYISETLTSPGGKDALAIITKVKDPSKLPALGPDGERIGKQWLKTEQLLTDQMLASPWNISSVLYDHSSGQYQMTLDPEKAASDKNYVLYSYVGGKLQPNFETENGKKQKLIAEGIVKDKIRSQIGQEITTQVARPQVEPKEPKQPVSEWMVNRGDSQRDFKLKGNMIAHLFSGDPAQVQAATSHFGGDPRFISVKRTADGIVVTDNKNITKTIPFRNPDGTVITQDDFIRSATPLLLGAGADINAVTQGARSTGRSKLNATAKAEAIATSPVQESGDIRSTIITKIGSDVEAIGLKDANGKFLKDKEILSVVQPLLTTLGIKARTYNWDEGIIITKRDGKTVEIPIDENFKRTLVSALNDAVPPDTGDATMGAVLEKLAVDLGVTGAAAKWNKKKTD